MIDLTKGNNEVVHITLTSYDMHEDEEFECQVCGKFITQDDGCTDVDGKWICDTDTCGWLDDENERHARNHT